MGDRLGFFVCYRWRLFVAGVLFHFAHAVAARDYAPRPRPIRDPACDWHPAMSCPVDIEDGYAASSGRGYVQKCPPRQVF